MNNLEHLATKGHVQNGDGGETEPGRFRFRTFLLFLFIAGLCWPVFVITTGSLSALFGEGSVVNAWHLQPRRLILQQFLEAYLYTLLVSVPLALLAVADYRILVHKLKKPKYTGLLWILSGVALTVYLLSYTNQVLLPVLLTAICLFTGYRLFLWLFRMA